MLYSLKVNRFSSKKRKKKSPHESRTRPYMPESFREMLFVVGLTHTSNFGMEAEVTLPTIRF